MSLSRRVRTLLATAGLSLLAACSAVPKAAPGYAVHDFGPLDSGPPKPLDFVIRNIEVVPAPWLASTAMNYRMLQSQPTRRQFFLESRWAAQPGQLVELAIRRAVRSSETTVAATGCRLLIDLDEFSQVFTTETTSEGRIEVRAFLLAPRSEQLIASRSFSIVRAAPTPNAIGGVAALSAGVGQLNQDLLGWLEALAAEQASGVRSRCGG